MEALRAIMLGPREPHEVPGTFWLPESTPQDPTLCAVCRRLDIRALVNPPPMTFELANLGRYVDIREKAADCRFCGLVVDVVRCSWGAVVEWDACEGLEDTECGLDNNLLVQIWPVPREASEATKGVNAAVVATGSVGVDVVKEDAAKVGLDGSSMFCGHARVVPEEVADQGWMREWVRICEEKHGGTCGKEVAANATRIPASLRVIDVVDMCLVPVSPSASSSSSSQPGDSKERARYLALSYVWGNISSVDSYKTTTSNFDARTLKNGLLDVPFPRTIRDAIITTRRLGERYLWVDAVCIIQNCPTDQAAQIGSMDIIYGAATLTLVAAGGDDAECILPRSHPGSPHKINQIVVTIGDEIRFTLPRKRLWDLENTTALAPRWFSRGWTYQERQLSVRMLVFTKEQVYFQCRVAGYSEDKAIEQASLDGKPILASRPAANPLRRMKKADTFMSKYKDLVEGYTERNLSFDSDALNAFMGVGNVLTELYGERFTLFYGLAGPCLEEALLWHPAATGSVIRRHDFPSWSWAGWRGKVTYSSESPGLRSSGGRPTIEHIISEFRLHLGGTESVILPGPSDDERRTLERLIKHALKPARFVRVRDIAKYPYTRVSDIPRDPGDQCRRPQVIGPGTLEFVAPVAPETAFKLVEGDFHLPDCRCFQTHHEPEDPTVAQKASTAKGVWKIVDEEGVTCGMLGGGVNYGMEEHCRRRRALVCLRRAGVRVGRAYDCPGFDSRKYPNEIESCFDVLLVEYADNGVARRVAVGRIHEYAWIKAAGLKWRILWLE